MRLAGPYSALLLSMLVALGAAGCRLGANNTEKLQALKSGESYDEDGVLSVAITSPEANTLINLPSDSTTFAASGTCSKEGATIELRIDDAAVPGATGIPCTGGKWDGSFDSTQLSNGSHSLVAWIRSDTGKEKQSTAVTFSRDTALPQLAILSPGNGSYIGTAVNSATFALSGTCSEDGQAITVTVDGSAAAAQSGGNCNGATWAATISTLGLSAGAHTLKAALSSASGNSQSSEAVVITKDTTAPTVALSTPAASSFVNLGNNSASFAVSGSCDDSGANVQVKVDGSNSGSAVSCGGTNWNATISTVALTEGAHTLTALITDMAGNATTSTAVAITKDTAAPSIAITAPAASSYVNLGNNSATFAIQGSCTTATENGRAITIQVNGANATQSAITCGASNAWSGTFSTAALSEASHTLTATIADAAGNSTTSSNVTITKDTSAPTVSITYPVAGLIINPHTNSTAFAVKGTCSENSRTVTLQIGGAAATGVASNTCASGSFSATLDTTGLGNAAHTITATQSDAAGNTGPASPPSVTVNKDATLSLGGSFTRASAANDLYTHAAAASGVARYSTVSNSTGILVEESTTQLITNSVGAGGSGTTLPTGWTHSNDAGYTVTTNVVADPVIAGHQAVEVTISNTSGTTKNYRLFFMPDLAAVAGETFSVSTAMEVVSGTVPINSGLGVHWGTVGTAAYLGESNGSSTHLPTGTRKRYCSTMTAPTNAGFVRPRLVFYGIPNGVSFTLRIVAPQLEKKGYCTSYVASSGSNATRAAETLSVPTAGNIQASQGAIVFRAYVNGDLAQTTPSQTHFLLDHNDGAGKHRIAINRSLDGYTKAVTSDSSGNVSTAQVSTVPSVGWHHYAIRWSSSELSLWIDGSKAAATANPKLPSSMSTNAYIGALLGVSEQWDQPIDYAAFYQHAPTDDDMEDYTTTGPAGANNRLDFEGVNFSRTSTAIHPSTGVSAASGVARFVTSSSGATGVLVEEGTTNLVNDLQSSIETGITGINANLNTSRAQSTEAAWTGSNSLLIQPTSNASSIGVWMGDFSVTPGQAYSLSAFFKQKTGGAVAVATTIEWRDASTLLYRDVGSGVVLTTSWQRVKIENKVAPAGAVTARITFYSGAATTSDAWYLDGIQFEQKAYATTWTAGLTTRSAEALTIPTAGNFTPGAWTANFDYVPTSTQVNSGKYGVLWHIHFDSNNYYAIVVRNNTGIPYLEVRSGGTTINTNNAADTALVPGTKYRITVKGNGSTMAMFINGVKTTAGDVTYTEPLGTLPSSMTLGSHATGVQFVNGYFDSISFFNNSVLSDSAITAFGANTPFTGANLQLDFSASLGQ